MSKIFFVPGAPGRVLTGPQRAGYNGDLTGYDFLPDRKEDLYMPEQNQSDFSDITLRAITPEDAGTVVRMVKELAEYIGVANKAVMKPDDLVRYAFGDQQYVKGLIAEQNRSPLGLCLYYPVFSSWQGRPGVYVLDLYVDETCRGSGLGQQILGEVARIAKEWDGRFMMLHVDHMNLSAQDFYAHLGFKHLGREKTFLVGEKAFQGLAALDR